MTLYRKDTDTLYPYSTPISNGASDARIAELEKQVRDLRADADRKQGRLDHEEAAAMRSRQDAAERIAKAQERRDNAWKEGLEDEYDEVETRGDDGKELTPEERIKRAQERRDNAWKEGLDL